MRRAIVILSLLLCTSAWAQDSLNVTRVGSYSTSGFTAAIAIGGNYLYEANYIAGLRILDVSNPSNPVEVGQCPAAATANAVQVSGNFAYVTTWYFALQIIDISNPLAPFAVGSISMSQLGLAIREDYLYVAADESGLQIVDVSTPNNPIVAGSCDTPGRSWAVALDEDYAYVADGDSGLRIIDISNPLSPIEIGHYDTPSAALDVAVSDGFAYVADGDEGLRVIDVSDPSNPTEAGSYVSLFWTACATVSGDHAYVAGSNFHVLYVSNPPEPVPVGFYTPAGGGLMDVAVNGSMAYLAENARIGIYDIPAALGTSPSFILPPSSFRLSAYPNPFNATTQIRFDVPRSSLVQLRIYDLQGRIVENLASRVFDAGTHTLSYDASARASGMYVVQMTSGDYSTAQKVMLLK